MAKVILCNVHVSSYPLKCPPVKASKIIKVGDSTAIQKQSQTFPPLFKSDKILSTIIHADREHRRQSLLWAALVSTVSRNFKKPSKPDNLQERVHRAFFTVTFAESNQRNQKHSQWNPTKLSTSCLPRNRKHSHSLNSVTCNTCKTTMTVLTFALLHLALFSWH